MCKQNPSQASTEAFSVSPGIQGRCEGTQIRLDMDKNGSHSLQLAVSEFLEDSEVLFMLSGEMGFDLWQWLPGVTGQKGWQLYYLFAWYQIKHFFEFVPGFIMLFENIFFEILGS